MVLWASENASRTPEGCFLHRIPLRYTQRPVFCTECIFRTPEAPLCTEFRKTTEKRRALTAHVPGTFDLYIRRPSLRSRRKEPERAKRAESSQKQAASAAELRTSQKEADLFVDLIDRLDANCNYLCRRKLFRENQRQKILVPWAVMG